MNSPTPLPHPPENMRPDRPEVMALPGGGVKLALAPGVTFECLVGAHNHARDLTTGLLTLTPGARTLPEPQTAGVTLTLLTSGGIVEVEDHRYELSPLDNVTIPRGLALGVRNQTGSPCVFHRATGPAGTPGRESVIRASTARRYEAGPNTAFLDYFNAMLVPGIALSGGYALFQQGGRLPAHVHDFDESISIIQGHATCIVEGRRYLLSDNATAMVPRGRIHYFINETEAPMAMIWVYAGPMPVRIEVDERLATIEGIAWR